VRPRVKKRRGEPQQRPVNRCGGDGGKPKKAIDPHVFYPSICKAGEALLAVNEAWIPIARGTTLPDTHKVAATYAALDDTLFGLCKEACEKVAAGDYSHTLRGLGELAGYLPGGHYSWQIPGAPHYLQGALGGALIGAGLGYGTGWLGSRILPKTWDRSRLPKTMAILGSMAGMAPGLASILSSAAKGSNSVDDAIFDAPPPNANSYQPSLPAYPNGPQSPALFLPNPEYNASAPLPARPSLYRVVNAAFDDVIGDVVHPIVKEATSQTGYELDFSHLGTSHLGPWFDAVTQGSDEGFATGNRGQHSLAHPEGQAPA
jgi:hypothetical protein